MTTAYKTIWETYVQSWKAETRAEKLALYAESLHEQCVYADPLRLTQDWESLADYMQEFHRQFPGGHFVTTWFLAHNQSSIATWEMRDGHGSVLSTGISFGAYNEAQQLVKMIGFYETS